MLSGAPITGRRFPSSKGWDFLREDKFSVGLGDPQVFRFANQNESARAFTRTHTLMLLSKTDHSLSPYVNSALF